MTTPTPLPSANQPLTPANAEPSRGSALARWLPIVSWLPAYQRGWLKDDVIAGLGPVSYTHLTLPTSDLV